MTPKTKSKSKKPAAAPAPDKAAVPAYSFDAKSFTLIADCDAKADSLEVIRSAAYVLTDRAYAQLSDGPQGTVRVRLQLKDGTPEALKALQTTFGDELATQRIRHQIARNNVSIREYIVEQAIHLAQQPAQGAPPPQAPAEPELTEAQRKEIERLIAEVEDEIRAMAPAKAAQDPLRISATWEETHAPKKGD